MSEVQTTPEHNQAISSLKKQADLLGISYKANVSMATLQQAIKAKLEAPVEGEAQTTTEDEAVSAGKTKEDLYKEAMKLVRVIVTPMDSLKASNMDSDVFCAGNSVVGTVKRVIPFGVEWHVEQILLNTIKERKFQMYTVKKHGNREETVARQVRAYSVVELEPLTQAEIDALADQQLRTRSLEDD